MAEEIAKDQAIPDQQPVPASRPQATKSSQKSADRSASKIRLASTLDYAVGISLADGSCFMLDSKGRAELDASALGSTPLPSGVLKQQF